MKKTISFLWLLLPFLLISSIANAGTDETNKKRVTLKRLKKKIIVETRAPSDFNLQVGDQNTALFITFYGQLYNADITVTDANGQHVVEQTQQNIHDGQFLTIPQADNYPYHIEIDSPVMEISADIIQEEE